MLALLLQGMSIAAAEPATPPAAPPPPPGEASAEGAPPPPPPEAVRPRGGRPWEKMEKGEREKGKRPPRGRLSPEALEKLSPEERQRFQKNLERWKKLSPDRRNSLRSGELHRRQRIEKETRETLEKSGVALSESQRNFFIKRYETERRQLEENLRKELDEKRQKGIEELSARLLKEAQAQPLETVKPEEKPGAPATPTAPSPTAPASPAPAEATPSV